MAESQGDTAPGTRLKARSRKHGAKGLGAQAIDFSQFVWIILADADAQAEKPFVAFDQNMKIQQERITSNAGSQPMISGWHQNPSNYVFQPSLLPAEQACLSLSLSDTPPSLRLGMK